MTILEAILVALILSLFAQLYGFIRIARLIQEQNILLAGEEEDDDDPDDPEEEERVFLVEKKEREAA